MASTPPQPIHCTASGAKLLAPMTEGATCARFVAAYAKASGAKAVMSRSRPSNGFVVDLRFLPHGVATAAVTRLRGGRASTPVSFNLSVSDRPFNADDIDQLAATAAAGLRTSPSPSR